MIDIRLEEIKNIFSSFNTLDDKWLYLIDLAKQHNIGIIPEMKTQDFIIQGCSTTMYLIPTWNGETIHFDVDSETTGKAPLISMGLVKLALYIYNDCTPKEILSVNKSFFTDIGLNIGLTATRNNGFASALDKIYKYAELYALLT